MHCRTLLTVDVLRSAAVFHELLLNCGFLAIVPQNVGVDPVVHQRKPSVFGLAVGVEQQRDDARVGNHGTRDVLPAQRRGQLQLRPETVVQLQVIRARSVRRRGLQLKASESDIEDKALGHAQVNCAIQVLPVRVLPLGQEVYAVHALITRLSTAVWEIHVDLKESKEHSCAG